MRAFALFVARISPSLQEVILLGKVKLNNLLPLPSILHAFLKSNVLIYSTIAIQILYLCDYLIDIIPTKQAP